VSAALRRRTAAVLALVPALFAVLVLLVPTAADAQTVYSFTNAGATGRFGPTQSQVNNAYSGTTLGGQVSINTQGVQEWVVPASGRYRFTVAGAHGAASTGASNQRGGRGALITAERELTAGQRLFIVAGQAGSATAAHGAGGGASFVSVGSRTATSALIVAGGGGGTRTGATANGGDASTATHGLSATTNSGTAIANQNNTVDIGFRSSGDAPRRGTTSSAWTDVGFGGIGAVSCYGDGGAGWFGNGHRDAQLGVQAVALNSTAVGGGAPSTTAHGGFGGGGAGQGCNGGGGGGGYTGGNGGWIAGGGGSFVSGFTSTSIGIDTGRIFARSGTPQHGYVTITFAGKQDQTISFADPGTRSFGTNFTLTASATSGLPVTLTSLTTTVCTVSGSTLTPVAAGTCQVRASQAGDASFNAAPNVTRTFTIAKANQSISFSAPANRSFSAVPFSLSASATSGLAVTFTSTSPAVCVVSGSNVTMLRAGTCSIAADQSGNANYNAAATVARSFAIERLVQTVGFAGGEQVQEFSFTGAPQAYTVPSGASRITIEVWGAQGGDITTHQPITGGLGGYTKGTLTVSPGDQLAVYVGGQGQDRLGDHPYATCEEVPGGWNGGGFTRTRGNGTPGGGASDVRTVGGAWDGASSLASRLIVAGGGGGGGWTFAQGGAGGGSTAVDGVAAGADGTQSNRAGTGGQGGSSVGGAGGTLGGTCITPDLRAGRLGIGGAASGSSAGGGAGGGGYYGGGGGGFGDAGGGGSSYLVASATDGEFQRGVRAGDGFVRITAEVADALADGTFPYQEDPVPLAAFATSGLTPTVTSLTPTTCLANADGTLSLLLPGTCTLRVTQDGDDRYLAASPFDRTVTILPAEQSITFDVEQRVTVRPDVAGALQAEVERTVSGAGGAGLIYGDGTFIVVAEATSGLEVSITSTTPAVCTTGGVRGTEVSVRAAGDCTLVADQSGDVIYAAAPSASITFPVARRELTAPSIALATRTYNATTVAGTLTIGQLAGLVGSETVGASATVGPYGSPDVGTRSATLSFALSDGTGGGRAANYVLADVNVTGEIIARPLTLVPTAVSRTTDDAVPTFAVTAFGLAPGESVASVDTWAFCPGGDLGACEAADGVAFLSLGDVSAAPRSTTVSAYRFRAGDITLAASRPVSNYTISRLNAAYEVALGSPATTTIESWSPGAAASGAAFTAQPTVTLRDAGGNPITSGPGSDATVTATISGAGGALIGSLTATAFEGTVTFSGLGLTGIAGTAYTLTFTASYLDPSDPSLTITLDGLMPGGTARAASQTVTATFGAPAALALATVAEDYDARSGQAFVVAPEVEVRDAQGNVVTSSALRISVSTATPGARISGELAPTASSGRAAFSPLTIAGTTGDVTLRFSAPGVTDATQTVTVASGPVAQLELTTRAAGSRAGAPFTTAPSVTLRDAEGNKVTGAHDVRITLVPVAGTGTLIDTSAPDDEDADLALTFDAAVNDGVATFSDLGIVGIAGTTYRIEYGVVGGSGDIDATIAPAVQFLTVVTGDPYELSLVREPSASTRVAAPLVVAPRLAVRDRGGNLVSGSTVSVTAASATAGVTLSGATVTADTSLIELADLQLTGPIPTTARLTFSATFEGQELSLATGGLEPVADVTLASGAPARLLVRAGDGQPLSSTAGASGRALAGVATVVVVDTAGNTVPDAIGTVVATVGLRTDVAGGGALDGSLIGRASRQVAEGRVTFDGLGVRGTAGATYEITFTVTVDDVTMSETLLVELSAGAPVAMSVDTASASVSSGAIGPWSPSVTLLDADGNVVTDPADQVDVVAQLEQVIRSIPALSGWNELTTGAFVGDVDASLPATRSGRVRAADGVATFAGLGLEGVVGQAYMVTFVGEGLSPVTQTVTIASAGAPDNVALVRGAAGGRSGVAFTVQPRLEVRDAAGNVVRLGADQTIDVDVTVTGTGAPSLAGATAQRQGSAEGQVAIVTFPAGALALAGKVGVEYTLTYAVAFVDGAADPVTVASPTQTVSVAAGDPATLAVVTAPDGAAAGRAFTTQPVIEVRDATDNPVLDFSGTVRVTPAVGLTSVGTTEVPVLRARRGSATSDCGARPARDVA
jgi:hypothetical protein